MIGCRKGCPLEKHNGCCMVCEELEKCDRVCLLNPVTCIDSVISKSSRAAVKFILQAEKRKLIDLVLKINCYKEESDKWRAVLKERIEEFIAYSGPLCYEDEVIKINCSENEIKIIISTETAEIKYPEVIYKYSYTSKFVQEVFKREK